MISYLESFERINFFGEDAEDVLSAGRPHTPVGGGTFPTHVPSVATSGMNTNLKHFLSRMMQMTVFKPVVFYNQSNCNF